jgi:hypothetical protein
MMNPNPGQPPDFIERSNHVRALAVSPRTKYQFPTSSGPRRRLPSAKAQRRVWTSNIEREVRFTISSAFVAMRLLASITLAAVVYNPHDGGVQ